MPVSIDEGVSNAKATLRAAKAIRAQFPDATWRDFPGGYGGWCSAKAIPDDFLLVVKGDHATCLLYQTVGESRVYLEPYLGYSDLFTLLYRMEKEAPDLRKALLEFMVASQSKWSE